MKLSVKLSQEVHCKPSGTQQQLVAGVAAPSVVSLCSFDWSKAEIFFNVYKYFYHLSASVSLDTVDWTTLSSCDCRDKSLLRTIHTPKKLSSAVSQQFRSRGGYSGETILDRGEHIPYWWQTLSWNFGIIYNWQGNALKVRCHENMGTILNPERDFTPHIYPCWVEGWFICGLVSGNDHFLFVFLL